MSVDLVAASTEGHSHVLYNNGRKRWELLSSRLKWAEKFQKMQIMEAVKNSCSSLSCDKGTNFFGVRREFTECFKAIDQEKVQVLKNVFELWAASGKSGTRTIRCFLTAAPNQSAQRLYQTSLRTFLYSYGHLTADQSHF